MNAVAKTPSGTMIAETSTITLIAEAEINQQIATAHRFPRSIQTFRSDVLTLATITEAAAVECSYALPRDGKVIEGPSARFAEIIANAWGNCRVGARVVDEDASFITSQGVFHDLQRNVAIAFEVKRRITGKSGKRYNEDMIATTGNAASSIALRNAVLKGVPKALWQDLWEEARKVARGDFKTLANRRADALKMFQGYGVSAEQIFSFCEVKGVEDITLDHLVVLRGLITAFKEGDATPEETFAPKQASAPPRPTAQQDPAAKAGAASAAPPKPPAPTENTKPQDPPPAETSEARSDPSAASGPSSAAPARSAPEADAALEGDAPAGRDWGSDVSEQWAYDEGYKAFRDGVASRAVPGEYREAGREKEQAQWQNGWRDARDESSGQA